MTSRLTRLPATAAAIAALTLASSLVGTAAAPASHAADPIPVVVDGMGLDRDGTAVLNDLEREVVAPGLVHLRYDRLGPDGWQHINVLKAELSDSTVGLRYLTPETVAGPGGTVSEMVASGGAIAGVNLDRFDINNSNAAAGWGIRDGEIIKSGNPDASASVGVDADGLGVLVNLALEGTVSFPDTPVDPALRVLGVNVFSAPGDGVVVYNSQWGAYSRARVVPSPTDGVEVLVAGGRVTAAADRVGAGTLPTGTQALVAPKNTPSADRLAALRVGDRVEVGYSVNEENLDVQQAGGAWHPLLTDGAPWAFPNEDHFTSLNPRTMIGFSEDRRTAYFVVVDGRTAVAKGMGFGELGRLMQDLGAHDAINADGGGSSQMNVQRPGQATSTVVNSPSDGYERSDGDGMGLVLARPGSGVLDGFVVEPTSTDENAVRVFPGMQRTLAAHAHDDALQPVAATPATWESDRAAVASVADGVVSGRSSGDAVVTARRGEATGALPVQVLGEPVALRVDQNVVNLEAVGSSAVVTFTAQDAQGFVAPVEVPDLEIVNPDPQTFAVRPTDDGRVEIEATGSEGAAVITFRHGDLEAQVSVAVPLELRLIDDFADVSGWTTAQDRAPTGGIEPGEGHEGSPSIRVNYDFTQSTGTRGRYAVAPGAVAGGTGGIPIPGRPQKLSVWVKGDGKGSLLRLQVLQGNNVVNWIDGPGGAQSLHTTWTGWQRQDFVVPSSFTFPLRLQRIRVLETVAAKQYTGSLEFSKIYAYLPPEGMTAPEVDRVEDPVVAQADATDASSLRVAVLSDAQFVARDPESGAVQGARTALREIVAARPDALVINGDFVDEASPADFDLARRILTEELGGASFPWYYVPGNHEIMGGAISNFIQEFGPTTHTFDLDGTRFVTLNSATGTLASDFAQVRALRGELDDAATDPDVSGVVVMTHMPTQDPLPTKGSQLSDRNEAELLDDWIQDFREDSGKSIASIASHVGVFHASSVDGVPYVINGNSGKSPASTPADGGFTGWTMLGIDPAEGRWETRPDGGADWLRAEVNTRVESLDVTDPDTVLPAGAVVDLAPVVVQDDTREVPVAWPTSFRWTGGPDVFVGPYDEAPATAIAAIDPATQQLTALRTGWGTATLEVNDVAQEITFEVSGGELELDGEPTYGETLSAELGAWADGADVTYAWLRGDEPVAGATAASYELGSADVGSVVSVRATVRAEDRAPLTVTSSTARAVDLATQVAPRPGLTGDAVVGSTLTAAAGTWRPGTTLTYAWLRDGAVVPGAVASSYAPVTGDVGARLQVRVTGHLEGHRAAEATSDPTLPVRAATGPGTEPQPSLQPVGSAVPTLAGTARVGQLLRARTGGWEPGTSYAYQWLRGDAEIPGADGASYRLTEADLRHRLSVRVVGTLAGRTAVARTSEPTVSVRPGRLVKRPKVRLAGRAEVGSVLRVKAGRWESGVRLAYRWYAGQRPLTVAEARTLRLRVTHAGLRVRVRVTATKPGYAPVVRWSAPTRVRR